MSLYFFGYRKVVCFRAPFSGWCLNYNVSNFCLLCKSVRFILCKPYAHYTERDAQENANCAGCFSNVLRFDRRLCRGCFKSARNSRKNRAKFLPDAREAWHLTKVGKEHKIAVYINRGLERVPVTRRHRELPALGTERARHGEWLHEGGRENRPTFAALRR